MSDRQGTCTIGDLVIFQWSEDISGLWKQEDLLWTDGSNYRAWEDSGRTAGWLGLREGAINGSGM